VANTAQAKRYAQAVFLIARQRQELDPWLEDLRVLSGLDHSEAFVKALETPNLSFDDKSRLLRDRYPTVRPLAVNLVNLLVERRRVALLLPIFQEYQRLLDNERGVQRAEVVTAVPLTDEDRLQLETRLSEITGKKVLITAKVDPSVIGGMIARFDGTLLDGSTKSKLEALKKQIAGVPR
jgi:F-type H+-transporting ATPase subunit delta